MQKKFCPMTDKRTDNYIFARRKSCFIYTEYIEWFPGKLNSLDIIWHRLPLELFGCFDAPPRPEYQEGVPWVWILWEGDAWKTLYEYEFSTMLCFTNSWIWWQETLQWLHCQSLWGPMSKEEQHEYKHLCLCLLIQATCIKPSCRLFIYSCYLCADKKCHTHKTHWACILRMYVVKPLTPL